MDRDLFKQLREMYGPLYNAGLTKFPDGSGFGPGHYDQQLRWKQSAGNIAHLALAVGVAPPALILDVGCGRATLCEHLRDRGYFAVGLDLALDKGVQVQGNIVEIPFVTSAFAVAVALDVVEHVPAEDLQTALKELRRVAFHTILTVPAHGKELRLGAEAGPQHHYLDLSSLAWEEEFRAAGFEILGRRQDLAPMGMPFNFGVDNHPYFLRR